MCIRDSSIMIIINDVTTLLSNRPSHLSFLRLHTANVLLICTITTKYILDDETRKGILFSTLLTWSISQVSKVIFVLAIKLIGGCIYWTKPNSSSQASLILKKRHLWLYVRNILQNFFALAFEVLYMSLAVSRNQFVMMGIFTFLMIFEQIIIPALIKFLSIPFPRVNLISYCDAFNL
eukprot:TRINITY_DN5722_c0_g1_i3.p1 TRINITY_DN5722_c0_g1~~TRINITY_DN5722_c0_g1_i3.p1  ORF type:complete len:204 (-),score=9.96 TRINITY_DN5722_c0_g1_i3:125-658(-)